MSYNVTKSCSSVHPTFRMNQHSLFYYIAELVITCDAGLGGGEKTKDFGCVAYATKQAI